MDQPQAEGIVPDSVIFWFRRDLRLTDNAGLHAALRHGKPVVPLFILTLLSRIPWKTNQTAGSYLSGNPGKTEGGT